MVTSGNDIGLATPLLTLQLQMSHLQHLGAYANTTHCVTLKAISLIAQSAYNGSPSDSGYSSLLPVWAMYICLVVVALNMINYMITHVPAFFAF